ncbi:MAG: protein TolA, partial [Herbaspirillum sp.]
MTDSAPYLVPKEPGRWRAAMLALVVHVALLVFLWVGVSWQSETPVGVEAEIWSPQNREAVPLPKVALPPEKTVEPKPKPEPKPEPKPVIKEVIKPPVVEPVQKAPDIALEQEKKRKAELKR